MQTKEREVLSQGVDTSTKMKLVALELNSSFVHVITSPEHDFIVPANQMLNFLGITHSKRNLGSLYSKLRANAGFVENVHYLKHRKGDVPIYKNLKPGSFLLTKLGLIILCGFYNTRESVKLEKWAMDITYEKLTAKKETKVNKLISSILKEVCRIADCDLRERIVHKIKLIENELK